MSFPKTRKEMPLTPLSLPTVGSMGKTGSWRTFKPVVNYSTCTKCTLCWIYCPDGAITRREDDSPEIDYEYCKGCGICANECPVKAITMEREEE
ncbi:MAG: 4Fe-4S binding protein [Candidatus Bathyarchaeota archaeon]|jgi:2-oxoacid:acceptor oxidoreductase delta subunit (pyruvate/2-ketoisovalerate family)|nr:4Fe-4S binding protein [Candidatus Bathyarchaeota archaeon A05DMB-3]MDH7606325.1 4Fe-4S binding protein [Candidatus Bathyarchaeota archaeon]